MNRGKPHKAITTCNFHACSRSFMIQFQPKRHMLKYGLFCTLMMMMMMRPVPNLLKGLRHAIFVYFQKLNGVFASGEFQK